MFGDLPGNAAPDSRWWYWIAALPAAAALWFLSFLWAALAATAELGAGLSGNPIAVAFELSVLVGGIPIGVVGVLLPVAVFFDSRAVRREGFEWPTPATYAALSALSLLVPPVAVGVAAHYVYRRRRRVGVP
jgi:hypothetical protein